MNYFWLYLFAVIMNLPFGYARSFFPKKSWRNFGIKMFLIHFPIPFVVLLRGSLGIERSWVTILIGVAFGLLGQFIGNRLLPRLIGAPRREQNPDGVTPGPAHVEIEGESN